MEYLHNYSNEGDFIRNYYRDIVLTSVTVDDEVYTYHKTAKTPGGYSAIWTNGVKYIMAPNVFESPGMPYIERLFDVTDFYPDFNFIFSESDLERRMHQITGYTISSFGSEESDYRKPFVSYEKGSKSVKYNKLMIDIETTYGDVPGARPGVTQEGITKLLIDGKEMPIKINDGPVKIQCDTIKLNRREADACLGEPCVERIFDEDYSIYPLLENDWTKKALSLNNCQTFHDFFDIEFENRRYPYFRELDVKKCFYYPDDDYEHSNDASNGIIGFYCFNDLIFPFNALEATSDSSIDINSYIGGSQLTISVNIEIDGETGVVEIPTYFMFSDYDCYVQDIIDLVNENTQPLGNNNRYTKKQPFFILQKSGETKLYCGRENINQLINEIWEEQSEEN